MAAVQSQSPESKSKAMAVEVLQFARHRVQGPLPSLLKKEPSPLLIPEKVHELRAEAMKCPCNSCLRKARQAALKASVAASASPQVRALRKAAIFASEKRVQFRGVVKTVQIEKIGTKKVPRAAGPSLSELRKQKKVPRAAGPSLSELLNSLEQQSKKPSNYRPELLPMRRLRAQATVQ